MKKTTLFFVAAFVATMFFSGFVYAKSKENTSKYMIIDIQNGNVEYSNYEPLGGWTDTYKTTKLVMRRINSGNFLMGSPESELGRSRNETQHNVTITLPFYISVFEITQSQYQLITGYNPSRLKGNTRPVDNVSYDEINSYFLNKIREKMGLNFDLPTEAQWEYACRAETTNAWNNGSDIDNTDQDKELNKLGRYKYNQNDLKGDCSEHTTVGSYLPNAWGLYDMHGNVWEWCLDWYGDIEKKPATNPSGPSYGTYRVLRGGSWDTGANNCRSAMRNMYPPNKFDANLGFRVVIINNKNENENESLTNPIPVDTNKTYKASSEGSWLSIILDIWTNDNKKEIKPSFTINFNLKEKITNIKKNIIIWIQEKIAILEDFIIGFIWLVILIVVMFSLIFSVFSIRD